MSPDRIRLSITANVNSLRNVMEYIRNDAALCTESDNQPLEDKADKLAVLANDIADAIDKFYGKKNGS